MIEHTFNGVAQPLVTPKPVLVAEWPLWAKAMKQFSRPEDKGLGDTIERVIGPVGGDAYKLWYKTTFGKTCGGCNKRKDNLNLRYPATAT